MTSGFEIRTKCDLDIYGLEVRYLRNTVTFRYRTESGLVIRTRYRGQMESYLNKTATFIYDEIEQQKCLKVGQIIESLHQEYEAVDSETLSEDCISCLFELWKLVLIEWVGINPFVQYLNGKEVGIRQAAHDDSKYIVKVFKTGALCVDPSTGFKSTRSQIISLILSEDYQVLVYETSSTIDAAIIATRSDRCSIIAMGGSIDGLSVIIDYLKNNCSQEITVQVLHGSVNSLSYNTMGLKFCGVLKSETKEGDVDVYIL